MSGSHLKPISNSLLTRTSTVIVISALVIALTAILSLNVFVISPLLERSAADKAALLVLTANTWVELPPERRPKLETEVQIEHDLIVSEVQETLPTASLGETYYKLLTEELEQQVGQPVEIKTSHEMLWVDVPTRSGLALRIGFSPQLPHVRQIYVGLAMLFVVVFIVLITSFLVVRRISRPLTQVAEAAESFRGMGEFEPLPETGLDEFVSLTKSFNKMANEIQTLITNRSTLSGGISHDLRTPLTRMRLAVELLPSNVDETLVQRFKNNLESMDSLITDAAYFARGERERASNVDFKEFIGSIVDSLEKTIDVEWVGDVPATMKVPTGALERSISNLIQNAIRHAEGAHIRVNLEEDKFVLHVIDDGPGIPKKDRVNVLQPFVRLDESRNTATGGSGLGLAIVAQLCQIHGWEIELNESETGGTDASLTVPFISSR